MNDIYIYILWKKICKICNANGKKAITY
ncbi:unnamed protein product, partial [Nezara viridula]